MIDYHQKKNNARKVVEARHIQDLLKQLEASDNMGASLEK